MRKLEVEDIEPMERELEKCYRDFSSGFMYRGVFWDRRCARNAIAYLKARRDFEQGR